MQPVPGQAQVDHDFQASTIQVYQEEEDRELAPAVALVFSTNDVRLD